MVSWLCKCARDHPITLSFIFSSPLLPLVTGVLTLVANSDNPHSYVKRYHVKWRSLGRSWQFATSVSVGLGPPCGTRCLEDRLSITRGTALSLSSQIASASPHEILAGQCHAVKPGLGVRRHREHHVETRCPSIAHARTL